MQDEAYHVFSGSVPEKATINRVFTVKSPHRHRKWGLREIVFQEVD